MAEQRNPSNQGENRQGNNQGNQGGQGQSTNQGDRDQMNRGGNQGQGNRQGRTQGNPDQPRDEQGQFISDDDASKGSSTGRAGSESNRGTGDKR
jgi:hypothetical protein